MIPQSALDGHAGARAIAYGLRHDLVFVAAYFLGRAVVPQFRRVGAVIVVGAAAVAAWGLIEVYAVPIEWWRHSGAVGYFHHELGYDYHGPAGLPENFAFNTSDGLFRRLDLDVRLAPCDRVHARRGADPRRRRPPPVVARHRARRRLRGRAALDVLALVDRRARRRARRARDRPPPLVAGRRGGGRRGRRARVRLDLPRRRAADALVRLGSPVPGGAGEGEGPATSLERPERHREPRRAVDQEPLGEPEGRRSGRSSTTRRATGSATPARPPSAST